MDINPKQIAKSSSKRETQFVSNRDQFEKDDDDPLSFKDVSSSVVGIILAIMTILFPAISVFLERPLLQKNGVIYNEIIKNDGY
tara:strand:- start:499 stop:750 length:252 start_codon:yes stop_codon:yes gene_type:complete